MKLTITIDDAKDLDGSIKKAIDDAVTGMVRSKIQSTVDEAIEKHSKVIIDRLTSNMERGITNAVATRINEMVSGGFGVTSSNRIDAQRLYRESFQTTIENHFSIPKLDAKMESLAHEYVPGIIRSEMRKLVESEFKVIIDDYKQQVVSQMKSLVKKVEG